MMINDDCGRTGHHWQETGRTADRGGDFGPKKIAYRCTRCGAAKLGESLRQPKKKREKKHARPTQTKTD